MQSDSDITKVIRNFSKVLIDTPDLPTSFKVLSLTAMQMQMMKEMKVLKSRVKTVTTIQRLLRRFLKVSQVMISPSMRKRRRRRRMNRKGKQKAKARQKAWQMQMTGMVMATPP